MSEDAKHPGGRPTLYREEFVERARIMADAGMTDPEIAKCLGVKERTLYRWMVRHKEFCQAVKLGKEAPDDRVERSLYKRAVGYRVKTTKVMQYEGEPVYADYIENVQPDVAAAIFWLKNRRSDKWRDKSINEMVGKDEQPLAPCLTIMTNGKPPT